MDREMLRGKDITSRHELGRTESMTEYCVIPKQTDMKHMRESRGASTTGGRQENHACLPEPLSCSSLSILSPHYSSLTGKPSCLCLLPLILSAPPPAYSSTISLAIGHSLELDFITHICSPPPVSSPRIVSEPCPSLNTEITGYLNSVKIMVSLIKRFERQN